MSEHFKQALDTVAARRMLLELKAYTHTLPETLMLGANHLLNHMEVKAGEEDRAKLRGPAKPATLHKEKPRG